ncbi:MAG: hypothetical protein HBSAPP03_03560 [Phycisphaerae bacterium]|nr:MAG: hypothetical protein HBSAPP03_03560 [Phycisphaerae bacterium]
MTALDAVHLAAFDAILQLPGAEHPSAPGSIDSLAPHDRERALNIAVRRLAFQLLYEVDAAATPIDAIADRLAGVEGLGPMARDRVAALVRGAYESRLTADEEFQSLAPEWPTHRQAAVDRAILRLAHHELTTGLTPGKVVIHEAVELAKHFSTEKSPAFINALLDKVLRRVHPGGEP